MKRRSARHTTRRKVNRRRNTHRVQRGGEVRTINSDSIQSLLTELNKEPQGSRIQAYNKGQGFIVAFDNIDAAIQITGEEYKDGFATGNTYGITNENISQFEFQLI